VKVIHVLRKPLSEKSVAANVLRHGTGALNIDATRISTGGPSPSVERRQNKASGLSVGATGWITSPRPPSYNEQRAGELLGRWPANLILQHLPGCRPHAPGADCVPGCPVAGLDDQSGVSRSCRSVSHHGAYDGNSVTPILRGDSSPDNQYDDAGGASRFFKQVGGDGEGSEE